MIPRREFVALLVGTTMLTATARAQQASKPLRVGFLGPDLGSPSPAANFDAFQSRLRELGFISGNNLIIDHRALDDSRGPFVAAAELTRLQPDLIVANGPEIALQALLGASGFIPIVMIAVNYDPIARHYVASLPHPGGNVTGVIFQQIELAQKQVELLAEAFPNRLRVAVLWDALSADQFEAAERAAKSINMQLQSLKLENPPTISTQPWSAPRLAGHRRFLFSQAPFSSSKRQDLQNAQTRFACRRCSLPKTMFNKEA